MPAQTNDRDIPVRKADVDATTAAVEALDPGGAGLATEAKQDTQITAEQAILAALVAGGYVGLRLESLANEDFATQTTLTAVLAKLSADPATQTTLAAILAKLTADPATQTTLAAILAKLIAAPATEAKQDTIAICINSLRTTPRKTIAVAGVIDNGEVEITGLTASAPYELRCLRSTLATTTGASTHRLRRIYEATGGGAADLAWEEPAALAIASGVSYPYNPGPIMRADAAGKLWLRYDVTPGAPADDITETVVIDLLPMIAG